MTVLDRLASVAFALLWAVVGVGLFVALIRVALGLRDGHRHLIGVVIVAAALLLWEAGVLGLLVQHLIGLLAGNGSAPAPAPGAPR